MMAESFEQLAAALADRYGLERELGRGGMATVYLARPRPAARGLRSELGYAWGARESGFRKLVDFLSP